jgi:hypothetical protein
MTKDREITTYFNFRVDQTTLNKISSNINNLVNKLKATSDVAVRVRTAFEKTFSPSSSYISNTSKSLENINTSLTNSGGSVITTLGAAAITSKSVTESAAKTTAAISDSAKTTTTALSSTLASYQEKLVKSVGNVSGEVSNFQRDVKAIEIAGKTIAVSDDDQKKRIEGLSTVATKMQSNVRGLQSEAAKIGPLASGGLLSMSSALPADFAGLKSIPLPAEFAGLKSTSLRASPPPVSPSKRDPDPDGSKKAKNLKDQAKSTAEIRKNTEAVGSSSGLFGKFGSFLIAGGTIALVTKGVKSLVESISEAGTGLARMDRAAKEVGSSTQFLQTLQVGGKNWGVEADEITAMFAKLAKSQGDFVKGKNMDAINAFKKLGITIQDSKGNLISSEELILNTADALYKMAPGAERTAAATELLGDTGVKLLPILEQGRVGIRRYQEALIKTGAVSMDPARASAQKYNETLSAARERLEGIKNNILIGLLPQIEKVATKFLDWASNGKNVEEFIENVKSGATTLFNIMNTLWKVISKIYHALKETKDLWDDFSSSVWGGGEGVKAGVLTPKNVASGPVATTTTTTQNNNIIVNAPKGTSQDIVDALNKAMREAMAVLPGSPKAPLVLASV